MRLERLHARPTSLSGPVRRGLSDNVKSEVITGRWSAGESADLRDGGDAEDVVNGGVEGVYREFEAEGV